MTTSASFAAAGRVSADRLWDRHLAMASIGATPAGGVNRQALSTQDCQAQLQMAAWAAGLGLATTRDDAGNLFVRLPGSDAQAAPVLSGSHLDSQPTGGRFDGVYGVLAAFEAVQAIREAGVAPRRSIDVVAWMNEEGSRFAPGMMGSAVFAGARTLQQISEVTDSSGVSVEQALADSARRLQAIPLRPLGGPVHAYVEAHIEQGPLLERLGLPVGVVSGIQGKHTFDVVVTGEAAHAGTSTRAERRDALVAAVRIIGALNDAMFDPDDITRFTVGRLEVTPNAPSVVPSRVSFSIDLRHPDSGTLSRLSALVGQVCAEHAGACTVQARLLSSADSLTFPAEMRASIRDAAQALSIPCIEMPSAAGHDARYLHAIAPSGMIFVPCHLGITHNEAESAEPADLAAGARVLAHVLVELAA